MLITGGARGIGAETARRLVGKGAKVGSAHMGWIDTPLVQDAKKDLKAFGKMLEAMPGPLGRTVSVETCADAFVEGIAKRKTRVSVPGWVNAVRWLKPALTTVIGERETARRAPEVVPLMDQKVLPLGRSMSARTAELEQQPEAAPTA